MDYFRLVNICKVSKSIANVSDRSVSGIHGPEVSVRPQLSAKPGHRDSSEALTGSTPSSFHSEQLQALHVSVQIPTQAIP